MTDFPDLGFAKPDTTRAERQGAGEVIFGEGKTAEQIGAIARALLAAGQPRVLITRLDSEKARAVAKLWAADGSADVRRWRAPWEPADAHQDGENDGFGLHYDETGRIGYVGAAPTSDGAGVIGVVAAGTSDLPVAHEALFTATFLGNDVYRLIDVGVAGIHRLLAYVDALSACRAIVAVAGMEGALASVVGGLVPVPIIAVPTSVGYGASFGGLAALLTMLNSCASGVSVVNIDNGFGAAYQASLINHPREGLR